MLAPLRRTGFTLFALLSAAGVLLQPAPASAVVRNWNNAAGGSVGTATNWTPNGVPTAADNLIFPLAGTLTITIPSASVAQVLTHDYRNGVYNLSSDGTHSTSSSFGVGQLTQSGLNMTGGTFRPGSLYLGTAAGGYGRLTMRSGTGIPAPPPPTLQQTDSTQGGNYGGTGSGRLEILGGSTHTLAGYAIFASGPASLCTLIVSGRNNLLFQSSSFSTTNPRRGTAQFGVEGDFVGSIDNGGYVRIAGDAWVATRAASSSILRIGANTTVFSPALYAEKTLRIGDTGFSGSGAGAADVRLYKGSVIVGGLCTLGDPDGNSNAPRLQVEGGVFRMSGGFTRQSGTNFGHVGGTIHLEGGAISWPFGSWPVTSTIGAPQLWISNGLTTTIGTFAVGRGGQGLLRVARPNTRVNTLGFIALGDSAAGNGSIVVDSSAVMNIQSQLLVGNAGTGSVTVLHGGRLEPVSDLFFGVAAGSNATGLVSGPGSTVTLANLLNLGGLGGTPGGPSHLTVDSSGVVEVTSPTGSARVFPGTGHLTVREGAVFRAATLLLDGTCDLVAAKLDVASVQVGNTGSLLGRGLVTGSLQSSGLVDLTPPAGSLGVLRVNGTALLVGGGTLGVALGRGTGPRCDTLSCGGSLTLAGTLALHADPSFLRVVGDTFVVATASSVTGSFSSVTWNGAPASALFDVIVQPTRVLVVTKAATLGIESGPAPTALRFRSVASMARMAFELELPAEADARVTLHDVTGREVARLHEGRLAAGTHRMAVAERTLPSGMYFARAQVIRDGRTEVRTAKAVRIR